MKSEISRRRFVQTAGSALAAAPFIQSRVHGRSPNEILNLAIIGVGGLGSSHIKRFDQVANCRVAALCDVDPERLAKAAGTVTDQGAVKKYSDYRKLLDDRDIEAVCVATPDHWHTPIALAAILAGKHVYVEKPCSHNIHESNLLVQCAREHKKCVQHGTQRRSSASDMAGIRAMREGMIGDVYMAKAINHQLREKIGKAPEEAPPPGVDYDMWLGPAPKHAFTKNRWHYDWHWFWDYGGGDLVNDGIHQLDVAIWGMDLDLQYPTALIGSGAQLWYDDDHQTPDTQTIIYEYPGKQVIYEMRLWTPYKMEGHDNGTVFYGTKGKMEIGRAGSVVTGEDGKAVTLKAEDYGITSPGIAENFVMAARNDDPSMLNSPIDKGAVSSNICHLGNIAHRCGGVKLTYDPKTASITKASEKKDQANRLIRRDYRKGYELAYKS
jgi:predicted dehydrogenase